MTRLDVLAVLLTAVLGQYVEFCGLFASVEGRVGNLYASGMPGIGRRTDVNIVTLAIDDDQYLRWFAATSPLPSASVKGLVNALVNEGAPPSVLAVDLLTEDEAYREWAGALPAAPPIVWAASLDGGVVEPPDFSEWLRGRPIRLIARPGRVLGQPAADLPPSTLNWGIPVFSADDDGFVRRMPRVWYNRSAKDAEARNTFAYQVRKSYCKLMDGCHKHGKSDTLFLSEIPERSAFRDSLAKYVECAEWTPATPTGAAICTKWTRLEPLTGAIAVLGGIYRDPADTHAALGDQAVPGVALNAAAIRAEIVGPTARELSKLFGIVLDVGLGLLVTYIFKLRGRSTRWKTAVSLLVTVPLALLIALNLFALGMLWTSWGVMLAAGFGWNLVIDNLMPHDADVHGQPPRPAPAA